MTAPQPKMIQKVEEEIIVDNEYLSCVIFKLTFIFYSTTRSDHQDRTEIGIKPGAMMITNDEMMKCKMQDDN